MPMPPRSFAEPAFLNVIYHDRVVGTLAQDPNGLLVFEYSSEWIADGFSISPFSLPLEKRVFVAKPHPLNGVFGVFDDSLPDGWGRLLVDRLLRRHGADPFDVGVLARLSIIGASGLGALEYVPAMSLASQPGIEDLDNIAAECARMLRTDFSEDLDALFALGGSSGGARPKIMTDVDGSAWIIKFPSSHDAADAGLHEYRMACAAQRCGIIMPEVRLFPSRECAGYFGTRRFDRRRDAQGNAHKVHMVSAGGLLETSHRIPNLDYDLLMRLALRLTDSFDCVEQLYRLMCFNVLAGNRDDHAKNFSFIFDEDARAWRLSPAYDLTQSEGMNGEHATMVNGKGRGIELDDLVDVGQRAGMSLRKARAIASEVEEAVRTGLL
ncbi:MULTISPECIES: type II toxin-antitoxin system HipA family toxin [unclassified Adlercreutzia]|uniref:type II toxin-antitoxin system HipA family toxin n=1 Tax=unclassified Adlercreutzia TaxID=2636013 RepID=UPI00197E88C5|nr:MULTISPECIES: type II toxin-antitoxin system HipA family toxin [unclassified Adlercreutzia]